MADPENRKLIPRMITRELSAFDVKGQEDYNNKLANFEQQVDLSLEKWESEFSNLIGKKIIFYHNSWPYFAARFGLKTVEFLEPKPGITPSPSKLNQIIQIIKSNDIQLIASKSYFSDRVPKFIATKTSVKTVILAQFVGALDGIVSYFDLFETNLRILSEAYGLKND